MSNTARRPTALIVVAVVLAIAVIVVGIVFAFTVNAPAPAASGSPTPSVSVSASETPTPTPTTPQADPADPSTWVITFTSIGPATLGEDRAATRALFPAIADTTDPLCVDEYTRLRPANGFFVLLAGQGDPTRVAGLQLGAGLDGVDPAVSPKTEAGIGLGMTLDELQGAYPDLQAGRVGPVSAQFAVTDGAGRWIAFNVINGIVWGIQVASESDLPVGNGTASGIPSERCPA